MTSRPVSFTFSWVLGASVTTGAAVFIGSTEALPNNENPVNAARLMPPLCFTTTLVFGLGENAGVSAGSSCQVNLASNHASASTKSRFSPCCTCFSGTFCNCFISCCVSNNGFIAHFYIKRENYLTQLSGSQQGQHQDLQGPDTEPARHGC